MPRRSSSADAKGRLQRDGMVAGATAVAITLTWYGGWIALESVSVAGAFAVTAATLWLLRQDRAADYYRSLVPMVVFTVGAYDGTATHIPIEVSAIGSGIAYNVLVNLFPKVGGTSPIMGQSYLSQLAAGEHDVVRIAALPPGRFLGFLEVGYFDIDGRPHAAWHTVTAAGGKLQTTDALNWNCPQGCPVHRFNRKPRPS